MEENIPNISTASTQESVTALEVQTSQQTQPAKVVTGVTACDDVEPSTAKNILKEDHDEEFIDDCNSESDCEEDGCSQCNYSGSSDSEMDVLSDARVRPIPDQLEEYPEDEITVMGDAFENGYYNNSSGAESMRQEHTMKDITTLTPVSVCKRHKYMEESFHLERNSCRFYGNMNNDEMTITREPVDPEYGDLETDEDSSEYARSTLVDPRRCTGFYNPPPVVEENFQENVLLVPGVNECTVGNIEAILDCMKNFCGSYQQFKMVDNLEMALKRCNPESQIYLGSGLHPITSLGMIGRNGGQLCGPISGNGQAIICPTTSDHVWLNILRTSSVSIQNITILLDQPCSSISKIYETVAGPSVGLLVQGQLRLRNVIITTKLNDDSSNIPRAVTAIEMTERTSLQMLESTIKHCSMGLITQNDAETEIYLSNIMHCVIGFQSSAHAKNYIRSLNFTNCENYAFMVDSTTKCGESTVEELKEEDSFCIEQVQIKDCNTHVYFIQSESSLDGSLNVTPK